jgi:hypothetical protein
LGLAEKNLNKEKFMRVVSLVVVFIASSLAAIGAEPTFNQDLQVYQFVEEIESPKNFEVPLVKPALQRADLDETAILFDQLVNLGKKVWALVENNKPVVNVSYLYANALPKGVRSSEELENFSELQHRTFRVSAQNLFGVTVYDLTYSLVHRYGGNFKGRGKYLENVAVIPTALDVVWGYNVAYKVEKVSVVNTGTSENPVASVLLETNFKVSTAVKSSEEHSVYDFRGDSAKVNSVQH